MTHPQPIASQPEVATNGQSQPTTRPAGASGQYEACAECGAPLDRQQRYCVNCGARRADAANPASRYLAVATRRRQTAATATRTRPPQGSGTRVAAVAFFALLPLAVAIGVLVGRSGGTDNSDLLNALRSQPATAATGSGTNVSDTSSKLLSSDFSLDKGYTVKLDLLPIESTDQAAASKAEADAKGKGAGDVASPGFGSAEVLEETIRPVLSKHFKPALLARMRIVPYYPVGGPVLRELIEIKLGRLGERLNRRQLDFTYSQDLVDHLAERCTQSDSGARDRL